MTVPGGPIVIVGGGLASAKLIRAYREAGGAEPIRLISADSSVPYHRPPLSKRYLRGEAEAPDVLVEPEGFYAEQGVEVSLGTIAERLEDGAVVLAGGGRVPFARLAIASGATPRRLGVSGEGLEGVSVLRTLAHSTAIRERARAARTAVVVGAGFIGMEVAASLRTLGLDVTLVHRGRALFETLAAPRASDFLADLYRERGVELVLDETVTEFRGDGSLRTVVTSGGRELPADLAVVGAGVEPSVGWLQGSGLELENGVVVSERFEASRANVYAVGDVAAFHDPVLGRRRRIEHWSNANYQGAELGRILAGAGGGYDVVSSFFTEVFGATFRVLGDPTGHDELEVEGDFAEGKALVRYLAGGSLVAALLMGQDEATENGLKEQIRADAAAATP